MVLRYAATAASGCVAATRAGPSSLGFAARNDHTSESSTQRAEKPSPRSDSEAGHAQTPGPHSHGQMCGRYSLRYKCGTQNFQRQKVGGEAITDSTDRAAVSSSESCTLGSCTIPAPHLRPKARRCRNGRSLRAGGVAHPLADVDRLLKRPRRRGPWDSARARIAVRGMMPATFSLLLCVHAGSPWPSLIFISRNAGSEVAFP